MTTCRALLALAAVTLLAPAALAQSGVGQVPPPLDLPSERRPELPIPEPEVEGPLTLEPSPTPAPPVPALHVRVSTVRVVGNSVLRDAVVHQVLSPWLARELTSADLEALRQALTRAYVERGYVTSGALLPDQDFAGGVLEIQVVEGRLAGVRVEGNRRLSAGFLRSRLSPRPDEPVRIDRLEERLQLLQRNPVVESLHAELRPGLRIGESILFVRVVETRGLELGADVSNDRSPVIGATNGTLFAGVHGLSGWDDHLGAQVRISEGLRDVAASWDGPALPRWETRAGLRFRWAESEVVDGPFEPLDIESEFLSGGVELTQPVYRSLVDELSVGLLAEWRRARNYLLGTGFSFSQGADRGESSVAPLRGIAQWLRRDASQVIALRSTLSLGLPVLGATDVSGAVADARFVSWILQGQWARRFDQWRGLEVIARGDLQLASDPLLSIEQFSLGGHASVRGYRENQIVRDNGYATSLELRIPLWRTPEGRPLVQLAPFSDVGRAWDDADRQTAASQTLASVGVGLRVQPTSWLRGVLYWGHRLVGVGNPHDDPQDEGIYFRVVGTAF